MPNSDRVKPRAADAFPGSKNLTHPHIQHNLIFSIFKKTIDSEINIFKKSIMSFQAYLKNIKEKTGLGPSEFRDLADKKGFTQQGMLLPAVKATEITDWLKSEYALGHGHAMAIYALLKGIKDETSP